MDDHDETTFATSIDAASPNASISPLTRLPSELLLHCLSYLSVLDLTCASSTCRTLRAATATESLWQGHVESNLHTCLHSPRPYSSFRDLYIAHNAYWFLTRRKVWISDYLPHGKVMVTRYNPVNGCIEGHAVVAERGEHTVSGWAEDPRVLIHSFEPEVKLHFDSPVLRLGPSNTRVARPRTAVASVSQTPRPSLAQEILMDCSHGDESNAIRSSFFLARDYPPESLYPGSAVWPSQIFPSPGRAYSASSSEFEASSHRPTKHSQVSQSAFRFRIWMEFRNRRSSSGNGSIVQSAGPDHLGLIQSLLPSFRNIVPSIERRGFDTFTFGTLDPECYTPTPSKPWRGIYCGDYSGHGCEFLIVMQPDDPLWPLPDGLAWLQDWLNSGNAHEDGRSDLTRRTFTRMNEILVDLAARDGFDHRDLDDAADENHFATDEDDDWMEPEGVPGEIGPQTDGASSMLDTCESHSGRLVAVKLTGDPHIPRGQITFIAPDLSDKALVRTCDEDVFKGARVVRSAGHVAGRGFMNDSYIPSQLILVSHDCLAQYWQGFGHISFYRRVDLDALLAAQS